MSDPIKQAVDDILDGRTPDQVKERKSRQEWRRGGVKEAALWMLAAFVLTALFAVERDQANPWWQTVIASAVGVVLISVPVLFFLGWVRPWLNPAAMSKPRPVGTALERLDDTLRNKRWVFISLVVVSFLLTLLIIDTVVALVLRNW